jgi:YidC/Oxa1 family membrane protein insertase
MLRTDLKKHICPEIVPYAAQHGKSVTQLSCDQVAHLTHQAAGAAKFLFIPDLTNHATGAVLGVLIVLYVGTQLASGLLMSTTADRNQRMIMLALPVIFVPIIINFPAGLVVYWITTNAWTIVQGLIVRRTVGPAPVPVPKTAGAKAAVPVRSGAKESGEKPQAAAPAERKQRARAARVGGKDGAKAEGAKPEGATSGSRTGGRRRSGPDGGGDERRPARSGRAGSGAPRARARRPWRERRGARGVRGRPHPR